MYLAALVRNMVVRIALVVFDVALVVGAIGLVGPLELGEDILVGFVQQMRQHVEPSAVGHADHHLLNPQLRTSAH